MVEVAAERRAFIAQRRRPFPFLLAGRGATGGHRGRSFAGAGPRARLVVRGARWCEVTAAGDGGGASGPSRLRGRGDPFDAIDAFVGRHVRSRPGAIAVGFLGYDLGRLAVGRALPRPGPGDLPDAHLAAYDDVAEVDAGGAVALAALPGEPSAPSGAAWRSDVDREEWRRRIARALEHIRAGDVYQINLSRRFVADIGAADPFALWCRLADASPAPYAAYLDLGATQVLSISPELFLRVDGTARTVETRPIKGTRPRGATPDEDLAQARALAASEKDRAEHVMIVDLERNDLGRVARTGTVGVSDLWAPYPLPTVHHLETVVRAALRDDATLADVLRATFPGGSITGAPKIRAMEIIADLERAPRGPYCGAVALFGPGADAVLSIAIRTAVARRGVVTYRAGGGIVADSDADAEFDETEWKAAAFLRALDARPRG